MVMTSGLLDPAALNVDSGFSGASRNGLNPEFGRIHEKGHVLGVDNAQQLEAFGMLLRFDTTCNFGLLW
jgi:hypothetical protein